MLQTSPLSVNFRRRLFGALLSFEHLLIILFWQTIMPIGAILGSAICWPHFSSCGDLNEFLSNNLTASLWVYGVIAVAGIFSFLCLDQPAVSKTLLTSLNLIKALFILSDLRLGGNFHYIPFLLSAIYILYREPERALQWALVLCYFVAGFLKLNSLWTGGYLTAQIALPKFLVELGPWYAVTLELLLIWFLLGQRKKLFAFVFIQLILFHLVSIPSVLWFYPSVMLLLLTVFIIFPDPPRLKYFQIPLLVLFGLLQLPHFLIRGDSSVTGEGRVWALNMYDGMTDCHVIVDVQSAESAHEVTIDPDLHTHARIHCDPLLYFQWARRFCEKGPVALSLSSRSLNWEQAYEIVQQKNICPLGYNTLTGNAWISSEGELPHINSPMIDTTLHWPSHFFSADQAPKISGNLITAEEFRLVDGSRVLKSGNNVLIRQMGDRSLWSINFKGEGSLSTLMGIDSSVLVLWQKDPGHATLFSFDIQSGKILWAIPQSPWVATPALNSDHLYVGVSAFNKISSTDMTLPITAHFQILRVNPNNGKIEASSEVYEIPLGKRLQLLPSSLGLAISGASLPMLSFETLKSVR